MEDAIDDMRNQFKSNVKDKGSRPSLVEHGIHFHVKM